MFWGGFIAGFIIGGFLGILIISCLVVGKRADEEILRQAQDDKPKSYGTRGYIP